MIARHLSFVVFALLVGCARKQAVDGPPPTMADPPPTPVTNGALPAESSIGAPVEDAWPAKRRLIEARVHFEFDRFDLTQAAREILEAKVPILLEMRGVAIRIEGHADERGSDEYNLILSRRRAAEVKRFLVGRGVEDGRLEVFGFGEEQPAMAASNEEAWTINRRAEFRITAGGPPTS